MSGLLPGQFTEQVHPKNPRAVGLSNCKLCVNVQDVKKHDDPDLVVLATDECLFADEGFRQVTDRAGHASYAQCNVYVS